MTDAGDEPERVATIQQLWTDGDYRRIGELFAPISEQIVAELDAQEPLSGRRVLDAATGTGNTALALAARGAKVRAFDLTPRLLDIARARAEQAGLEVEFLEGDLLDIPAETDSVGLVVSTFGAFTVDDHLGCMRELVRVCRPGGRILSTAWADGGFFATQRGVIIDAHPGLMDPARPDPQAWSEPEELEAMLADLPATVRVQRRTQDFYFASADAAWDLLEEASGPVQRMRAGVVAEEGDWAALRAEVVRRWEADGRPASDGGLWLTGEYAVAEIEVVAEGDRREASMAGW